MMRQKYTKMQEAIRMIRARKAAGETNRQIGKRLGLTVRQIEQLINRENRRERKIAAGVVVRPKGRPRKSSATPEGIKEQELQRLRMQVEVLQNFLSEAGRR